MPDIPVGHIEDAEIKEFIKNGFFVLKSGVLLEEIVRAKQYVDKNYSDWLSISKRSDDWRCHFEVDFSDLLNPIEHGELLEILLQSTSVL